MKKRIAITILVILMTAASISTVYAAVPKTSIYAVAKDEAVTVQTADFPAGHTFRVYMGYRGTGGRNGILVSKLTTGEGGSFLVKFAIPEELKGENIVEMLFESDMGEHYSQCWFFNESVVNTASSSSSVTYNKLDPGVPAWNILSVSKGASVTIQTRYFPAQQRYAVFMKNGALADLNWIEVKGIETGEGNSQIITIPIPASLQYYEKLSIKLYNVNDGSYWYNMFFNINQ